MPVQREDDISPGHRMIIVDIENAEFTVYTGKGKHGGGRCIYR